MAGRGVAFLVGIDYYLHLGHLRHAVDDARAWRSLLIERGYAPQNIVTVLASSDPGDRDVPILTTNGLATPRTDGSSGSAIFEMDETRRRGAMRAVATKPVIANAFRGFLAMAQARKATHALLVFLGHGAQFAVDVGAESIKLSKVLMADHMPYATGSVETAFLPDG